MTETTPEAREAVTYPVEERAFHVVRYTGDCVVEFRASDRATLSSFPARDRDDAYAMAETLNRVVRFHVERALALSPPAVSEAVEAEREGEREALIRVATCLQRFIQSVGPKRRDGTYRFGGIASYEDIQEACAASNNARDVLDATSIRARTSISEVVG